MEPIDVAKRVLADISQRKAAAVAPPHVSESLFQYASGMVSGAREVLRALEKESVMPHAAFVVHMLNDIGRVKAGSIAKVFDAAVAELEQLCPSSREWSIVLTKLEEACFFAKKAMANDRLNTAGAVMPGATPPPAPPILTADGDHELVLPAPAVAEAPHDQAIHGLKPTT